MKTLFFVEPQESTIIWTGMPSALPAEVVSLWLPTEADQEIAAEEGGDRYEECASVEKVLAQLRAGEDADACWDNSINGDWCGFEWREVEEGEEEEDE